MGLSYKYAACQPASNDVSSNGDSSEDKQQQTFIICARYKKYIVKSEDNYLAGCDKT